MSSLYTSDKNEPVKYVNMLQPLKLSDTLKTHTLKALPLKMTVPLVMVKLLMMIMMMFLAINGAASCFRKLTMTQFGQPIKTSQ